MGGHGRSQSPQIISALQSRDNATLTMAICQFADLLGEPNEIFDLPIQLRQLGLTCDLAVINKSP